MYVFDSGGYSRDYLLNKYMTEYPNAGHRVGKHTFQDLITLLTKRGEAKAGLSTYYIRFRSASKIFVEMMERLKVITVHCLSENIKKNY